MVRGARQVLSLKEIFLQDPPWELSMSSLLHRGEQETLARLSRDINQDPKRARVEILLVIGFSDEDKIGTIQPHNDALVITF